MDKQWRAIFRSRFVLQGWNSKYHKTNETSDNAPVYRLGSYTLYGVIPIASVRIFRHAGVWRLQREDSPVEFGIRKYGSAPQDNPFGKWGDDDGSTTMKVTVA